MSTTNKLTQKEQLKKLGAMNFDIASLTQENLKKIQEFEDRVEAMAKATGDDYTLRVEPGIGWAMNVESHVLTYPVRDLILKDIETTLGYALHEGGHRDITRMVDKFWHSKETLRALYNVVEDPRVNTYEQSKWAGSDLFLAKTYDLEWPKVDTTKPITFYDDYRVQPHMQFLNSIIYHYRYGVIDPRIKNSKVIEAFNCSINNIVKAYSKHPPRFKSPENDKRNAQIEMSEILKAQVVPAYEILIQESAKIVETGLLNGNIKLSATGQMSGQPMLGTLSLDELSQKARVFIEQKSKELADQLESKMSTHEKEELKKELTRDRKIKELKKTLNEESGKRIKSLKDLTENQIINERLREAQKTEWDKFLSPVAKLVTILIGLLENELTKDERQKYKGHYRTGKKIDLRKYLQYQASEYDPAYEKFWMRKTLPSKPSINFTLVLDESGSMADGERDLNAMKSLVLFIEVLNHFDMDFNIIGFSDSTSVHKEFNEKITPLNKDAFIKKVASFMGNGSTDDTAALSLAVNTIINESDAEHKVIIVLSDGEGNAGKSKTSGIDRNGRYYNIELKKVLEDAGQNGIDIVGIGIGEGIRYVSDIYGKSIVEKRIGHLPQAFADLLIEKVLEAKASHSNVVSTTN